MRGFDEPRTGFDKGTKLPNGFLIRVVGRRALRNELLGAKCQMQLDLVFHLALPSVAPAEREVEEPLDAAANHDALELAGLFVATVRMFVTVSA
jgi:hypothetical protein